MTMNSGANRADIPSRTFDDEVRDLVMSELKHNDWTRYTPIDVNVSGGTVTLPERCRAVRSVMPQSESPEGRPGYMG